MDTRTIMFVVISAAMGTASLAQAASPRPASGPRQSSVGIDVAQPLCGGNGTKTPPEGPAPPKEPPKT
jgi:hypothetical protein